MLQTPRLDSENFVSGGCVLAKVPDDKSNTNPLTQKSSALEVVAIRRKGAPSLQ